MEVRPGKPYNNRTKRYLGPISKVYGKGISQGLSMNQSLFWAIDDVKYSIFNEDNKYKLFILIDIYGVYDNKALEHVNKDKWLKFNSRFIKAARRNKYYLDDYIWDLRLNYHVLVFKIPDEYKNAYDNFLADKFSEMYTLEQIQKLDIRKKKNLFTYEVLTKDPEFKSQVIERINNLYGTNLEELDDREYDSHKISKLIETLNFDYVYVNEDIWN